MHWHSGPHTRLLPGRPRSGKAARSGQVTQSSVAREHSCCYPTWSWVKPATPKPPWTGWTSTSLTAHRCAPPWPCCGSPSTTRRPRSPRLPPVLDGSVVRIGVQPSWVVEALLLASAARDAVGDEDAAGRALQVAEPDRALVPFLLHPVRGRLERHARHATVHAALMVGGSTTDEAGSVCFLTGQDRDGNTMRHCKATSTTPSAPA